MPLTEKDFKKISLAFLIVVLGVLVFLVLRPVLLSVIGGLMIAYILYPAYEKVLALVKNRTFAAFVTSVALLIIIILPAWVLLPMASKQVFELFSISQSVDISSTIKSIFPTASEQFVSQIDITLNNALGKVTSSVLNRIVEFLVDFASVALHLFLMAFVFFFALKDGNKLREFVSGLSPLNKSQEGILTKQFKDITQSIVYGQIVIGLIQGILAAIGLFSFGVPNAIVLSLLAVMFSILPLIGPGIVYIPSTIYLLVTSTPTVALIYLAYNVLVVSTIDNVLRSHIVTRKTQISQAIILIGMIGGLFFFGILGLILGPLILAYFITFLRAYKDKTLSSFFSS